MRQGEDQHAHQALQLRQLLLAEHLRAVERDLTEVGGVLAQAIAGAMRARLAIFEAQVAFRVAVEQTIQRHERRYLFIEEA